MAIYAQSVTGPEESRKRPGRPTSLPPLSESHRELAAEADGWDPSTVTAGVNRKVPWICPRGHRYEASINNRSNGTGCPICAGRRVLVGYNDLATTHEDLAKESVVGDARAVTAGSGQRLRWRCARGHEWEAPVAGRVRGEGCPVCAGRAVVVGENDLATTHPEIAGGAHGWDPSTVVAGSNRRVAWHCAEGHEWEASVINRTRGHRCPYCAGQRVLAGYNDLATTHPELVKEVEGWDPTTVIAGTGKRLAWRCSLGHTWIARGAERVKGKGCPYCAGIKVLAGYNDLATTDPDLASQADGWDPTTVRGGNDKSQPWRCELGHRWTATINSRKAGVGCPVCANKRVLAGYNDLATTDPDLAAQAAGWDPTTVTAGAEKMRRWRCAEGHEWEAVVFNRRRGAGCPICAGQQVLAGYNDLATLRPDLVAEMVSGDPTSVTVSSGRPFRWRCAKGREWRASVASRTRGSGCPTCADYGFSVGKPGWLHLMNHEGWGLRQIGITNVPGTRRSQHERSGWVLLDLEGPMAGEDARAMEQILLRSLRARGIARADESVTGKFSGFTESWRTADLDVTTLQRLREAMND